MENLIEIYNGRGQDQIMVPKLYPAENQFGESVESHIPSEVNGIVTMRSSDRKIWERAKVFLRVRENDAHTLYSYGIARVLCEANPLADADVVLPAVLLHDTGWSQVPEDLVLAAINPAGKDPLLIKLHEREGVRIAREILTDLGTDPAVCDAISDIIFSHDSLQEATSLNDAIVKDADKLWRLTPHGLDTVMDWFGLDRNAANRLCSWRVHDYLHTDAAKTMARMLGAVASIDYLPERVELGGHECAADLR